MNPYTNYYINQVGGGLPAFSGIRYQRGHGFFGRLFSNTVLPFFKQLLPAIGKRALPSAIGLAQDVLSGQNVGKSTLSRLEEMGRNVADETMDQIKTKLQKGSGRRRRKKKFRVTKQIKRKKVYKKKKKRVKRKKRKFNFLE